MREFYVWRFLLAPLFAAWLVVSPEVSLMAAEPVADPTNPEHHKLAAEYSAARKGLSVLVRVDGKEVFADYTNGGGQNRAHELASGTKSFNGIMAAAAIQDGLIKSWDEKVSDTITEWKDDETKQNITLRHLLSLTSGMGGGQIARVPTFADAIQTTVRFEPGQRFQYGPAPFQTFGELLRRKLSETKETPLDYLQRRIFKPIDLQVGSWRKGVDGMPHLPSGAHLTAPEWAKFGELVRAGGSWNGKEIVQQKLLDECFIPAKANPAYGLTWWLASAANNQRAALFPALARAAKGDGAQPLRVPDLVQAAGAGNQRLYISRQLKLVVVRQAGGILEALGGRDATEWSDREFLARLLYGTDAAGKKL
ncbi:Beta-lactamase [Anatilimnocola aggregata]|uniref:Beta-lactamase n=1 Tax=Anatilimnocola aggregata TaxID=2528021 RepID=A0A517YC43_9BACT|nr:serine hydrolase [Anatilimnocola aggregata]QDU27794.1 Beta-lactamase [Anatilimnocola aggregata]